MSSSLKHFIQSFADRGAITANDVTAFRQAFYADGAIAIEEVEALFDVNAKLTSYDDAWPELFREAIVDWAVNQAKPEGYMTAENADTLIALVTRDGRVCSATELEAVVAVIEQARWCPERLVTFALGAVRDAVVSGSGPLAHGGTIEAGRVTPAEVALLQRVLYAFGGDGNLAITQREAEILFDINDATADQDGCPEWTDLFCKAIVNAVMAAHDYASPPREEALRRAAWLDNPKSDVPEFFARMLSGGLAAVIADYRAQSSEDRAVARLERQRHAIITNEAVSEVEANWLAERLGRDGKLTLNEARLVDFLVNEAPKGHPGLMAKLRNLRRAA